MKTRACLSLLVLAVAVACGTATESPVAPPSLAAVSDGDPPPPPLDTQLVEVDGSATSDGSTVDLRHFSTRYFINKNENVAWITFESGVDQAGVPYTASAEARLLFTKLNTATPSVSGTGIISGPGGSIDLSKVTLSGSSLNSCSSTGIDEVVVTTVRGDYRTVNCGGVLFGKDGVTGGFTVSKLVPLVR